MGSYSYPIGIIDLIIAVILYTRNHNAIVYFIFTVLYIALGCVGVSILHITQKPSIGLEEGINSIRDCTVNEMTYGYYSGMGEKIGDVTLESGKAPHRTDTDIYNGLLEKLMAVSGVLKYHETDQRTFTRGYLDSFLEAGRAVKGRCGYKFGGYPEGIEGFRKNFDK